MSAPATDRRSSGRKPDESSRSADVLVRSSCLKNEECGRGCPRSGKTRRAYAPTIAITIVLLAPPARAAEPWHLPGWACRAVVRVTAPSSDADMDTAAVTVRCLGRARVDHADYRVTDAAGKPVPFQVAAHDPERESLLLFRAGDAKAAYHVYWGKPDPARAPEAVPFDPAPGAGPPSAAWVPRGLVLQTLERPRAKTLDAETNPESVDELRALMSRCPRVLGAKVVRGVSDGYNPFGASDFYVSAYRGWVRMPGGPTKFCTASNEASFSFLDGKTLVHWPGRHTAERGSRGEKNAAVDLTLGWHYLEYYHEETTLDQMAFLGWRTEPGEGPFSAIPESVFPAPHAATVSSYDSPAGPLLAFEATVMDSVWPVGRDEGQFTRILFKLADGVTLPPNAVPRWDFGDGQTATGREVAHVYLALGRFPVTLSVDGLTSCRGQAEAFEIEHVTPQFKEGRPADYAEAVNRYDPETLDAANLRELAYLLAEAERFERVPTVAAVYARRFPTGDAVSLSRVRRLAADAALRLGTGRLDKAIANYRAAVVPETPAAERLELLARLVRLLAERAPDEALKLLPEIESAARARLDEDGLRRLRQALIAVGDVHFERADTANAQRLYARAEAARPSPVPPQVRAARLGAYPTSLREYSEAGNYGAALDLVDRWDETFPTDKVNGASLFWRGKLLLARGQPSEAAKILRRAARPATGSDRETECRWLLGLALEAAGTPDEARREWAALARSGLDDEFTRKAAAKVRP